MDVIQATKTNVCTGFLASIPSDKVHLKAAEIQAKLLSWLEILAPTRNILLLQGLPFLSSLIFC